MSGIARNRLAAERKAWRKDHPHAFYARPEANADGSTNLMLWHCGIPGKQGTNWAGGIYPLTMEFSEDFPICLSILDEEKDWKPSITIKQLLLGIQDLLDDPNPGSPAHKEAIDLFNADKEQYQKAVRKQAAQYNNL
eukprot:TRINITY_DN8044_c0_g1_i1.p1 TRINITY_DN8044_c0_g1~~TRINITY_DN8044_c0_g1_i1.p1  ORF type:complete len:137 (+),score=21.03 TRINITY_DN8044_c0_g1_i1:106-516(+)